MKKTLLIVLGLLMLTGCTNNIQVQKVEFENGILTQPIKQYGLYYALPKNIIKLHIPIKKKTKSPARYSIYFQDLLGKYYPYKTLPSRYSKQISYNFLMPGIALDTVPDTNNIYYVKTNADYNKSLNLTLALNEQGILMNGDTAVSDKTSEYVVKSLETVASIVGKVIGLGKFSVAGVTKKSSKTVKMPEYANSIHILMLKYCDIIMANINKETLNSISFYKKKHKLQCITDKKERNIIIACLNNTRNTVNNSIISRVNEIANNNWNNTAALTDTQMKSIGDSITKLNGELQIIFKNFMNTADTPTVLEDVNNVSKILYSEINKDKKNLNDAIIIANEIKKCLNMKNQLLGFSESGSGKADADVLKMQLDALNDKEDKYLKLFLWSEDEEPLDMVFEINDEKVFQNSTAIPLLTISPRCELDILREENNADGQFEKKLNGIELLTIIPDTYFEKTEIETIEPIKITCKLYKNTAYAFPDIIEKSRSEISKKEKHSFCFKVPGQAVIEIEKTCGDGEAEPIYKDRFLLAQYGQTLYLPLKTGGEQGKYNFAMFSGSGALKNITVNADVMNPENISKVGAAAGGILDAIKERQTLEAAGEKEKQSTQLDLYEKYRAGKKEKSAAEKEKEDEIYTLTRDRDKLKLQKEINELNDALKDATTGDTTSEDTD